MEAIINRNSDQKQHRSMKEKRMNKDSGVTESEDDDLLRDGAADYDKRKMAAASGGASMKRGYSGGESSTKSCQAERCSADLSEAKTYHRRHKVCEHHAKAQVVVVAGIRQRFCQQCSRFHELSEFDEAKRSCRRRLAGHNERRRKNFTDNNSQAITEGSTSNRIKADTGIVCGQVDDRGRIDQYTVQENATYKHGFHVMR